MAMAMTRAAAMRGAHIAKRVLFFVARHTGALALTRRSRWRNRRLLILGYHSVSLEDEHLWSPTYSATIANMQRRFKAIKRNRCTVLPLMEAIEMLRSGELPERSVAITFDDGLFDFKERAYPLLKSNGFPATVFLQTSYCLFNRPVFDCVCSYLLWKGRGARLRLGEVLGHGQEAIDLSSVPARQAAMRAIKNAAQPLTIQERDGLARRLAESLGVDYGELCGKRVLTLLRPSEVQWLSRNGVDFQLHTHAHCMPPERDALIREIERNRAEIRAMTGRTPSHLCYPGGVYDARFLPWLRDAGVASASTCDPGLAGPATNPLLLPRIIDTCLSPVSTFAAWLTGFAHPFRSRSPAFTEAPAFPAPGSHSHASAAGAGH
jgi:peptidoglycan/xylan/chitin deacetylase (PgdA/CDA1 family)